jgi:DNA repair ATPase RecN
MKTPCDEVVNEMTGDQMFKTVDDIISEKKACNEILRTKISRDEWHDANEKRKTLKGFEEYAEKLEKMEYHYLMIEFDMATSALNEANDTKLQLLESIKIATERCDIANTQLTIIGAVLRTYESKMDEKREHLLNMQEQINQVKEARKNAPLSQIEKKKKVLPDEDYKNSMVFHHGRNKALALLREEGFDV